MLKRLILIISLSMVSLGIIGVSFAYIIKPEYGRAINGRLGEVFRKVECSDYEHKKYSYKLTDKLKGYIEQAKKSGIEVCQNQLDIQTTFKKGDLVRISSNKLYKIASLTHSYPYLTPNTNELLEEIGATFRLKLLDTGLKGTKLIITSLTRTKETVDSLGKSNPNASPQSSHLYGNTFDISYVRYSSGPRNLKNCEKQYMQEVLAEIIWQLRKEGKCRATYERNQSCFHVVAR